MDQSALIEMIGEAAKRRLLELNLGHKGIKTLPKEIGSLKDLQILYLRNNPLTSLPREIGDLISLQQLYLQYTHLEALPSELGLLSNLSYLEAYGIGLTVLPTDIHRWDKLLTLNVSFNKLTHLPETISHMRSLTTLDLRGNHLDELPAAIGNLKSLRYLDIDGNRLQQLPPVIGQLTGLRVLSASKNKISQVPPELGNLDNLQTLDLSANAVTFLPPELGRLKHLTSPDFRLNIENNPLLSPPIAIVEQGRAAIASYLQGQIENARRQWIAKLLLVGEGGVGKTSLVRALLKEPFDEHESTTHGITIRALNCKHPAQEGVKMQLNTWDFGGQEIYHATHQFFLTNRSVFLVVWNARLGFEQGKLYYWLDTIKALAPESPVLIVATHVDERDAALPLADLRKKYPQIVGHWTVSNRTGHGVEQLIGGIEAAAASLPLMGERWPEKWLRAAEAIRGLQTNFIDPGEMRRLMSSMGLEPLEQKVLSVWLHELGDILYYQDDDELRDMVVLKPEWVTRSISKVLESDKVINGLGIFTRDHMDEIWADANVSVRLHFLRLMERFDLSYRTLENRDISIVVERLRHDPPDGYLEEWKAMALSPASKSIAMKFQFASSLPAGIPTWFIARSHRFTTRTHWRYGAVFADRAERKHLALIEAHPHDRYVSLSVRGPQPQNFFALLREGLELTIRRFPGMRVMRSIPCPCTDSSIRCDYEFDLEYLERATGQHPPVMDVQCQKTFRTISVMGLLFGIHWRLQDQVLHEIEATRGDVQELIELTQREFLNIFRRDQASVDSNCPNVFTLSPRGPVQTLTGSYGKSLKDEWIGSEVELQLYCQAPGRWHPTSTGGRYVLRRPAEWLISLAPYLKKLLSVLKIAAKIKGPLQLDLKFKDHLQFMDKLSTTADLDLLESSREGVQTATGPDLRIIYQLLHALDEQHEWGRLRKFLTPEGHYLWLCNEHAAEYQS